jgi:hypothetical protein
LAQKGLRWWPAEGTYSLMCGSNHDDGTEFLKRRKWLTMLQSCRRIGEQRYSSTHS